MFTELRKAASKLFLFQGKKDDSDSSISSFEDLGAVPEPKKTLTEKYKKNSSAPTISPPKALYLSAPNGLPSDQDCAIVSTSSLTIAPLAPIRTTTTAINVPPPAKTRPKMKEKYTFTTQPANGQISSEPVNTTTERIYPNCDVRSGTWENIYVEKTDDRWAWEAKGSQDDWQAKGSPGF